MKDFDDIKMQGTAIKKSAKRIYKTVDGFIKYIVIYA
jgi:hypothetical protein